MDKALAYLLASKGVIASCDPVTLFSEISYRQVDGGSLDAGTPDVDAEYIPLHDGNCTRCR